MNLCVWKGAVLLLLIAGVFRFYNLGGLDPWEDEVHTYVDSIDLLPRLLNWEFSRVHSPMPYLEIKLVRAVLGHSDWTLRLPSALYGVASVMLLYWIVGRLIGWSVAFWSALLLAINPVALEWSREARMYSQWLTYALLLVAVSHAAIGGLRKDRDLHPAPALDWKWWLLGMLFMLVHASATLGITTIAAVGLWLGCQGFIWLLVCRDRRGWTVLLGSALATAVYLGSWSVVGIGRILTRLGKSPGGQYEPSDAAFLDEFMNVHASLAGYLPRGWAAVAWLVAVAGLIRLAVQGKHRTVVLIVMIGLMPWLTYSSIAKTGHFFTSRYVFVAVVGLSLGLGSLIAWAWSVKIRGKTVLARSLVLCALGGLMFLWLPVWQQVLFVPKMEVRHALAPIVEHATDDEVLVMVPDWFGSFKTYYSFGDHVKLIRPPLEARYAIVEADRIPGGSIEPFTDDFERLYNTDQEPAQAIPPAAWLFILDPDKRLHEVNRLLQAYGLDDPVLRGRFEKAAQGAYTLTVRISPGKFDHLVRTVGRKYR